MCVEQTHDRVESVCRDIIEGLAAALPISIEGEVHLRLNELEQNAHGFAYFYVVAVGLGGGTSSLTWPHLAGGCALPPPGAAWSFDSVCVEFDLWFRDADEDVLDVHVVIQPNFPVVATRRKAHVCHHGGVVV